MKHPQVYCNRRMRRTTALTFFAADGGPFNLEHGSSLARAWHDPVFLLPHGVGFCGVGRWIKLLLTAGSPLIVYLVWLDQHF